MTKFEKLMLILVRENIHFEYARAHTENFEWICDDNKFTAGYTDEDNGPILVVDERHSEDYSEDTAEDAAKRIKRILAK